MRARGVNFVTVQVVDIPWRRPCSLQHAGENRAKEANNE
jgi:hypothetical protein